MPENPDRTQTPPERVDVLTNEVAEIIAELIQISWKDGIRQGLDRAAQIPRHRRENLRCEPQHGGRCDR